MYNVSIPDISDEELLRRYQKIKPIVEVECVKYFLREFSKEELKNQSYINEAEKDIVKKVNMRLFVPCTGQDFECIHKYGHPMFFKPSIAEVLAQIPDGQVDFVDAFEIIEFPQVDNELIRNKIVFDNGYHISMVRLYTSRKNPKVRFIG